MIDPVRAAIALCFLCAILPGAGAARADADLATGIVISQPVTVAGNDFCQYFTAAWRDKEGSEGHTLAIRERPSARWGSEVTIEYAHRRIYRAQLPAARAAVRALGEDAAQAVFQAVQQAQLERLLHDADLATDEF